jgi:hypothetical protein
VDRDKTRRTIAFYGVDWFQRMTINDVMRLGDKRIWAFLFPNDVPFDIRPTYSNWECWIEPNDPLPIDKLITALRSPASRWAPELRSQTELAALGMMCPYFKARHSIFKAACRAQSWVRIMDRLREKKRTAKQVQDSLLDLLVTMRGWVGSGQHWQFHPPVSVYSDRVDPEFWSQSFQAHRSVDGHLTAACGALNECVRVIRETFERVPLHGNSAVNGWKAAFAAELGYCWHELTTKDPSTSYSKNGSSFIDFVTAAYRSIDGNSQEKWGRAVRQMLYDIPLLSGFDRFEPGRPDLSHSPTQGSVS